MAAVLAQVAPAKAPETLEILSVNVTAVQLFQGLVTQWNAVSVSTMDRADVVRMGLRYEAIPHVRRGLGIPNRPGDFAKLQIMETEALLAWAEARR